MKTIKDYVLILVLTVLAAACKKGGAGIEIKPDMFPYTVPAEQKPDATKPIDQEYDFQKVSYIAQYSRTLGKLPAVETETDEYTPLTEDEINKQGLAGVKDVFDEMQMYFFSRRIVELVFVKGDEFTAEYGVRKITLGGDGLKAILSDNTYANPMDVVRYVIAHEFGHYIHEVGSHPPVVDKSGYSIHGNRSIYSLQREYDTLSEDVFFGRYFASHAEVDVFTSMVLVDNKFKNWADVYKFFDKEIAEGENEGERGIVDFKGRKRAIEKVVKARS